MRILFRMIPPLLLVAIFLIVSPLAAKGPVDLIRIEGPDLAKPLEIDAPAILNRFDPWAGQFIGTGGPLEAAPRVGLPYEVFFYLESNGGEREPRYMFYYYPGRADTPGYIYLPGDGEPYYRLNIGTIMRGSSDGRWHRAMPTWDVLMADRLPTVTAPGGAGLSSTPLLVWIAAATGTALLAAIALWNFGRKGEPMPSRLRSH